MFATVLIVLFLAARVRFCRGDRGGSLHATDAADHGAGRCLDLHSQRVCVPVHQPRGILAQGGDTFTLLAANPWVYGNPGDLMSLGLRTSGGGVPESELLGALNSQLTGGGFGVGTSMGIGLATSGLGLGALLMVDSYLQGPTFMGVKGNLRGTVGMVGGLAFPLNLFGIEFHFGADVRPMVRIRVPVYGSTAAGLLSALASGDDLIASLSSADALYGLGIGIDAGLIMEWNGLAAGSR
ncbi:MAG: hypothetical protein MZV64_28645 [Ignavibacteriales bacterium]|nr:hypothetical protein [Ignavibacteriales bacterium]